MTVKKGGIRRYRDVSGDFGSRECQVGLSAKHISALIKPDANSQHGQCPLIQNLYRELIFNWLRYGVSLAAAYMKSPL